MENTSEIRRFERRPFVWELVGKLLDEELTSRRKNFARNVEFLPVFFKYITIGHFVISGYCCRALLARQHTNLYTWCAYHVTAEFIAATISIYVIFSSTDGPKPQAAQSYPVLLITLYLYISSILKIIRKSCVINLLRYIFI